MKKLKGKPKTFQEFKYDISDIKNKQLVTKGPLYCYDIYGNIMEMVTYDIETLEEFAKNTYKYDEKNRPTRYTYTRLTVFQTYDYEIYYSYDINGNLISEQQFGFQPNRIIYEYDKHGNLIKETKNKSTRTIQYKYKYDDKDNLLEQENDDQIISFKYDNNNKLIEKKIWSKILEEETTISEFNKIQRIQETNETFNNDQIKLDDHGNWIERLEFNEFGQTKYLITRTIKYFTETECEEIHKNNLINAELKRVEHEEWKKNKTERRRLKNEEFEKPRNKDTNSDDDLRNF